MSRVEVSPNFAIGYYLFALLIYLGYKVANTPSTGGTDQEIVSPLIGVAFVAAIIIGEYMISVGMTKSVCGFEQWDVAAMYTFIPWVFIVGAIKGILMIRPGWLVPFSNTIGYFLASAVFGMVDVFRKILKPKVTLSKDGEEESDKTAHSREVAKALQEIYEDESLLINQLTPDNVQGTINKFQKVGLMYTSSEYADLPENKGNPSAISMFNKYIEAVKKALWFKLFVSEFLWLFLAGILAISVTYNYIMNFGCKMTPDQIAKREATLAAMSAADAENAANQVSNTVSVTQ